MHKVLFIALCLVLLVSCEELTHQKHTEDLGLSEMDTLFFRFKRKKPVFRKIFRKPVFRKPVIKKIFKKPVIKKIFKKPVFKKIFRKPVIKKIFRKPVIKKPVFRKIFGRPVFRKPVIKKPVSATSIEKEIQDDKKTEKDNDSANKKIDAELKRFEAERNKESKAINNMFNQHFEPHITGRYKPDPINKTYVEGHKVKILDPNIKVNIPKGIKKTTSLFSKPPTKATILDVEGLDDENALDMTETMFKNELDFEDNILETKSLSTRSVNSNTAQNFENSCQTGKPFEFFDLQVSKCQEKQTSFVIDFKMEFTEVLATAWQGAPESKQKTLNIKNAKIIFEPSKVIITGKSGNSVDGYGAFLQISNGTYTITYADGVDVEIKENGAAKIWRFPSFANAEAITAGGALSAKAYFSQKDFSIANYVPIIKNTPIEGLVKFNVPYLTFTSGGTYTLLPYGYILRGEINPDASPILLFIKKLFKISDKTLREKIHPGLILKFFRPEDFKEIGAFVDIDIPKIPIIPKHLELVAPFRYEIGLNFPSFDQRVSCIFQVKFPHDSSTLRFLMYFKVGPFPVNNEIQGGAESMDVWKNPFGIKGLTISKIAIEAGIDLLHQPVSLVKFGCLGRITLPEVGEIETGIMLDASEKEKPKAIVVAAIQKFPASAIIKLIGKLARVKVIAKLPDFALEDAKMVVAPTGGSIGSTQFTPGFQLRGRLTIGKIEFASVNVAISTALTSALFTDYLCYIDGRTSQINLGPIKVTETILKVRVAVKKFLFEMYGYISIFGHKMGAEVSLKPTGYYLSTENVFTKLQIQIDKHVSFIKGSLKTKPINQISNAINSVVNKFTQGLLSVAKKATKVLAAGLRKIKLPKIKVPKVCRAGNTLDYSADDLENVQRQIEELDEYISVLDIGEYDHENVLIWRAIKRGVRRGVRAIKRTVKKTTNHVKKGYNKVKHGVKKGYNKVKHGVKKGYNHVKQGVKKGLNAAKKELQKLKNRLCAKTRTLINKANSKIAKANNEMKKASNKVSKLSSKIKGGGTTIFKIIKAEVSATVRGALKNAALGIHFDSVLFGKRVKFHVTVKSFDREHVQEYLKKKVMSAVKKILKPFK